jgi:hypothetical protein
MEAGVEGQVQDIEFRQNISVTNAEPRVAVSAFICAAFEWTGSFCPGSDVLDLGVVEGNDFIRWI